MKDQVLLRALLILALVVLCLFLANRYLADFLPIQVQGALPLVAAVLVGVAAVVSGLSDAVALLDHVSEYQRRRVLSSAFERGPFDQHDIEKATRFYIRQRCTTVDPSQEDEIRHVLATMSSELFPQIDAFLASDSPRRHLLVLADSGMGKTAFVLNYYARNARRTRQKHLKIALLWLGERGVNERIGAIPDKSETVLFLDALDEDPTAVGDHSKRVKSLMERCRDFRKVVITCRTQFFPRDEEIPVETGIARIGPRSAGDRGVYEFWKLYLAPFSDLEVERYLKRVYPFWRAGLRKKALIVVAKVRQLSARPMLLAHIPDVVARCAEISSRNELYHALIDAWLARESRWVPPTELLRYSYNLAKKMYLERDLRGSERVASEELATLATEWGLPLEKWQLTGRSLLNRDALGNYKFAHRSIMEYLFVQVVLRADPRTSGTLLTDQMTEFLLEAITPFEPALAHMMRHLRSDGVVVELTQYASLTASEVEAAIRSCENRRVLLGSWDHPDGVKMVYIVRGTLEVDTRYDSGSRVSEPLAPSWAVKVRILQRLMKLYPRSTKDLILEGRNARDTGFRPRWGSLTRVPLSSDDQSMVPKLAAEFISMRPLELSEDGPAQPTQASPVLRRVRGPRTTRWENSDQVKTRLSEWQHNVLEDCASALKKSLAGRLVDYLQYCETARESELIPPMQPGGTYTLRLSHLLLAKAACPAGSAQDGTCCHGA